MEIKSGSKKETEKIAHNFAKTLKGGEAIALIGDLGAGKTVFVQAVAKALGIKKRVLSPTFVFMRSYDALIGESKINLYHLDLYRGEVGDFKQLGLDELFSKDSIVIVEWAEKILKNLPKKTIVINIKKTGEKTRKISIR